MNENENIIHLFLESAEKFPDKIALVYNAEKITHSQLKVQVLQTAAAFSAKGIKQGDKVLVLLPMSLALYRTTLALFYIGATAVFLDEWVGLKRLNDCCKVVRCDAMIGSWKLRLISWLVPELRRIPIRLNASIHVSGATPEMAIVNSDPSALITFTTGSTGRPKAAVRTHRILSEQFNALKDIIRPSADEVDMPSLPIVLLINLAAGCTSVIPIYNSRKPQNMDAAGVWQQIESETVNRITASPYFIRRLAEFVLEHDKNTGRIRKIFTGGAPVFPRDAAVILKAFPKSEIRIVYGSTEAEPISTITAAELLGSTDNELLAVGRPSPKTNIKVIPITDHPIVVPGTTAFEKLFLPAGEVGEIVVSGPHVLTQYHNSEEAFRRNKIVVNGTVWHRTGDAGYLDEKGNLFLAGRCQQIITWQGQNIYPFIFENAFKAIPGIALGTVIQKAGKLLACIQPEAGADKEKIQAELKKFDIPFDLIFMDRIPLDKRHFSRIDYKILSEKISA